MSAEVLARAENLTKLFPRSAGLFAKVTGYVRAVDGVTFEIQKGETLGLVGESGCGKSTIGRLLLRLEEPTGGKVVFKGRDISTLDASSFRQVRRNMQIIFQDPYASLNPRLPVADIVAEPLVTHGLYRSRAERDRRVLEVLELVGLGRLHLRRYPHEFSGGQRQRIGIARALALNPELLICDEPVSALDVSIRAQILNLMRRLQRRLNLTYLFISHDLSVVRHISNRVAVMYLGKLVELADTEVLFGHPGHPYTQALLTAIPIPDPHRRDRQEIILEGDVPSPVNPPSGCRFRTRCPQAEARCAAEEPPFVEVEPRHWLACHRSLS